MTDRELRR